MKRITILTLCLALLGLTIPAMAAKQGQQQTDVRAFADLGDVGDAELVRSDEAIRTRVSAAAPAGVYTLWWVVWNTPEGCANAFACGEADLFDLEGDTGLAIGYAGGTVVGNGGTLNLTARLSEGEKLQGFPYPEFEAVGVSLTETSLVDSDHAEVHLVIKSHQRLIPGMVPTQRSTFNGGCVYEPPLVGSSPNYGTLGPNTCSDVFFAVFPSVDTP